jgi:hypothetical protein
MIQVKAFSLNRGEVNDTIKRKENIRPAREFFWHCAVKRAEAVKGP